MCLQSKTKRIYATIDATLHRWLDLCSDVPHHNTRSTSLGAISTIQVTPTTLSPTRQELKQKLVLHVCVSAKSNPNVDPNPIPNPFVTKVFYTAKTSLDTIIADLVELLCDVQQDVTTRYEYHTEFDEYYGLSVWNGKRKFKTGASLALKDIKDRCSGNQKRFDATERSMCKDCLRNCKRTCPNDDNICYIDIGIEVSKPSLQQRLKISNATTTLAVSSVAK